VHKPCTKSTCGYSSTLSPSTSTRSSIRIHFAGRGPDPRIRYGSGYGTRTAMRHSIIPEVIRSPPTPGLGIHPQTPRLRLRLA
jgi:hypothetical protein